MLKISDIREYQERRKALKTIGEFKALGRELRDKFGLTDREAIDIMNGDNEAILKILEKKGTA
jgi:hypothetical protein